MYGNLFDCSSREDEDDPEVASVAAKNIEDTRTTSNMGTHNHMEEIVLA